MPLQETATRGSASCRRGSLAGCPPSVATAAGLVLGMALRHSLGRQAGAGSVRHLAGTQRYLGAAYLAVGGPGPVGQLRRRGPLRRLPGDPPHLRPGGGHPGARCTSRGRAPVLSASPPRADGSLVGPAEVLLVATGPLFVVDAVRAARGVLRDRRHGLALFGGLGWRTLTGNWGHPEDCLAVGSCSRPPRGSSMDRFGRRGGAERPASSASPSSSSPWPCLGGGRPWPASAGVSTEPAGVEGWPILVVLVAPRRRRAARRRSSYCSTSRSSSRYNSYTPLTSSGPYLWARAERGRADPAGRVLVACGARRGGCHRTTTADRARDIAGAFFTGPARDRAELVLPMAGPGTVPPAGRSGEGVARFAFPPSPLVATGSGPPP